MAGSAGGAWGARVCSLLFCSHWLILVPTPPACFFSSRSAFLLFQSMGICFVGKRNFENFILQVSVFETKVWSHVSALTRSRW